MPGRYSERLTYAAPAGGCTTPPSMYGFSTGFTSIAFPNACTDHRGGPSATAFRQLKPDAGGAAVAVVDGGGGAAPVAVVDGAAAVVVGPGAAVVVVSMAAAGAADAAVTAGDGLREAWGLEHAASASAVMASAASAGRRRARRSTGARVSTVLSWESAPGWRSSAW